MKAQSPHYALWRWCYLKAFCYDNPSRGSHSLKEHQSHRSGHSPDGELPMLPNHSHVHGSPMTVSYCTFLHVRELSFDTHTYPQLFPMLALQFRQKRPYYTSLRCNISPNDLYPKYFKYKPLCLKHSCHFFFCIMLHFLNQLNTTKPNFNINYY